MEDAVKGSLLHGVIGVVIGLTLAGALHAQGGRGRLAFTEPSPMDFNDHEGYVSMFDGVSLKGWDGNAKFWRVENAAIVGESTPQNPSGNNYIVYKDVEAKDFTLKFEIKVEGAVSKNSARKIAMSIANSPLVKTAIAGEDANWGRVVMAVGKAGEPADRDKLSIWFGGIRVAHKGARDPGYDEATVSAAMKKPEISLKVALGLGKGRDRVLTCDLTKEYVAINGDYRS